MKNIQAGDKVARNDVLAIYDEDIVPKNMDFDKVYVVEATHARSLSIMYDLVEHDYETATLEGLTGEVNIDLISKVRETKMQIFCLKQIESVGHDEYGGKVIVAIDEMSARRIANEYVGDEGKIWTDSSKVSCEEVDTKEGGIILTDFNAG